MQIERLSITYFVKDDQILTIKYWRSNIDDQILGCLYQGISNLSCTFCMSPSSNKPDSTHQLVMVLFHCMVRHGTVRYGTVHFWGVFHWVLYLVPDTFLVPLRSRFHASRYRYQNVTCKLCWSLIGLRKSSLLRHWTCDMRPSSTALPARFKPAQPAKDRT